MKLTIVHGKKTKETRMRTMTMGVTMSMDVVDHGRELGMGATIFLEWVQTVTWICYVNMRVKKIMAEAVTGRGIGVALSKSTHTCNQQAPKRDMQLELHLQDRCNWICIYKTDAIGITLTTSKCACTRQMQLGMLPPVFECVVTLCQFMFYVNTLCELCLNG